MLITYQCPLWVGQYSCVGVIRAILCAAGEGSGLKSVHIEISICNVVSSVLPAGLSHTKSIKCIGSLAVVMAIGRHKSVYSIFGCDHHTFWMLSM